MNGRLYTNSKKLDSLMLIYAAALLPLTHNDADVRLMFVPLPFFVAYISWKYQ
jgi:hypothetical protein